MLMFMRSYIICIDIPCLSMYSPPTEPDIEKQVNIATTVQKYVYLSVIVSLSDCEWVQREESEETEWFASANFKGKLQDLQLLHMSFKMDSELEVSHALMYDTIVSDVNVMMLTAIAE